MTIWNKLRVCINIHISDKSFIYIKYVAVCNTHACLQYLKAKGNCFDRLIEQNDFVKRLYVDLWYVDLWYVDL